MGFVRSAIRWIGQVGRRALVVDVFFDALNQIEEINALTDMIRTANDPPRTLEELQSDGITSTILSSRHPWSVSGLHGAISTHLIILFEYPLLATMISPGGIQREMTDLAACRHESIYRTNPLTNVDMSDSMH